MTDFLYIRLSRRFWHHSCYYISDMEQLFRLMVTDWPFEKRYFAIGGDLEWFKNLDYSEMSEIIESTGKALGEMKKIRKTQLDKEIQETEKKLKRLKGGL